MYQKHSYMSLLSCLLALCFIVSLLASSSVEVAASVWNEYGPSVPVRAYSASGTNTGTFTEASNESWVPDGRVPNIFYTGTQLYDSGAYIEYWGNREVPARSYSSGTADGPYFSSVAGSSLTSPYYTRYRVPIGKVPLAANNKGTIIVVADVAKSVTGVRVILELVSGGSTDYYPLAWSDIEPFGEANGIMAYKIEIDTGSYESGFIDSGASITQNVLVDFMLDGDPDGLTSYFYRFYLYAVEMKPYEDESLSWFQKQWLKLDEILDEVADKTGFTAVTTAVGNAVTSILNGIYTVAIEPIIEWVDYWIVGSELVVVSEEQITNIMPYSSMLSTTGWTKEGTYSASDGVISVYRSDGQWLTERWLYGNIPIINGNKYYISMWMKAEYTGVTYGKAFQEWGVTWTNEAWDYDMPDNEWYKIDGTFTATENNSSKQIKYLIKSVSISAASTAKYTRPTLINLTSIYGAGNEPTYEEMNENITWDNWNPNTITITNYGPNTNSLFYKVNQLITFLGNIATKVSEEGLLPIFWEGVTTTYEAALVSLEAKLGAVWQVPAFVIELITTLLSTDETANEPILEVPALSWMGQQFYNGHEFNFNDIKDTLGAYYETLKFVMNATAISAFVALMYRKFHGFLDGSPSYSPGGVGRNGK